MITFVVSTLFFLLLHVVVTRWVQQPFHVVLKISRGYAAAALTLVGFFSIFHWRGLWRDAFLTRHDDGSLGYHIVWFIVGHLIADFLWLAYGYWTRESRPRGDLIVHHAAGLVVCGIAFYLQAGYAAIGMAISTEIMPVTTGLGAWGKAIGSARLEALAARLRVGALLGWRLPLWLFVFVVVVAKLYRGAGDQALLFWVALAAVLFILTLDAFWTVRSIRGLRRQKASPE